jgi:hypothetical protein
MEPAIRNGNHLYAERTANQIKVCRLLLERIIKHSDQYYFDELEMVSKPVQGGRFTSVSFIHHPRYSEAPRDSKLQRKIQKDKEDQDFELLFKIMSKHLRSFWD